MWAFCALQATAGIYVVHARLDARIAAQKKTAAPLRNRGAAMISITALAAAATITWMLDLSPAITAALFLAAAGYEFELRRQRKPESLQMPLTSVGQQALTLSVIYGTLLIAGLW